MPQRDQQVKRKRKQTNKNKLAKRIKKEGKKDISIIKKTRHEARLEKIKALCPSDCKFVIIPGYVIFVAVIYNGRHVVLLSFKDYTEPSEISEICKSNRFDGLIPHGGVEIMMFSEGFIPSNFAVKFNSDLEGTIHISSNEKGVILDNSYGLELTNSPIKLVLDRVTRGQVNTKLTVEAWSKDSRLQTFGLLFCMKLFCGNEIISRSTFLVETQSYSVRTSYTRRKCTDYRIASSPVAEYFIYVVVCPLKKIARIYKPVSSITLLPRKTDTFIQTYDEDGFPVHDLLPPHFDFYPTQPITPDTISSARKHFGRDLGIYTDPICTSIYDSFLQLMIDGHIDKHVPRDFQ